MGPSPRGLLHLPLHSLPSHPHREAVPGSLAPPRPPRGPRWVRLSHFSITCPWWALGCTPLERRRHDPPSPETLRVSSSPRGSKQGSGVVAQGCTVTLPTQVPSACGLRYVCVLYVVCVHLCYMWYIQHVHMLYAVCVSGMCVMCCVWCVHALLHVVCLCIVCMFYVLRVCCGVCIRYV